MTIQELFDLHNRVAIVTGGGNSSWDSNGDSIRRTWERL